MPKSISIIIILALVLISSLFVLYPTKKDTNPINSKPAETVLYHYFSGSLSGGIDEMIREVNRDQTENKVTAHALDHEAFKSMILSSINTSSSPELFTYWAGARTQALVDNGQLKSFDDLWEKKGLTKRFPKAIVKAASTYNGEKYFLPITQHLVVIFYNKNLLKKYSLSSPRSWEEFLHFCQIMQNNQIIPIALGALERWPAQFWFDYLLLRSAGPEFRQKLMSRQASYTDKRVIQTYKTWSELLQKSYFNINANEIDWDEAVKMVCRGEAAATLMGTWAIQMFTNNQECNMVAGIDFDYFTFPIIDPKVPVSSVGPVDGIVLAKGVLNHQFAKSIIEYFSKPSAQQIMSEGSGALAPSSEVPLNFYTPFKQRLFKDIIATESWAFNYDLSTPHEIAELGMDSFNEIIAFPNQFREILFNLEEEVSKINPTINSQP